MRFNQTGCWIFLRVGFWLWLKSELSLSSCSLACRHRTRYWSCWHFWGRKLGVCCWFLILFFFFPPVSSFTRLRFGRRCRSFRSGFRCGTWWLSKKNGTSGIFFGRFGLFVAPTERPVAFSSGVVMKFNAGNVVLSDISLVHGCK